MCVERRDVSGQALIECLVAAMVLVPLVLLVVWLGKIDSLRQAGIAASRTLAFECTVRPEACQRAAQHPELADELRRRVFSRLDSPVLTEDRVADLPADRNPLWVDRGNRPLLERFSDVAIRIDLPSFDAGVAVAESRAGGVVDGVASLADALAGPGRFGLTTGGGFVDARVQVAVTPSARSDGFRTQLNSIPLRIHAHTAILTDAWNASGPRGGASSVQARAGQGARIADLYESTIDARYALTRGFIGAMGAIGLEPAAEQFRYRDIDVDQVPADRIGRVESAP